MSPLIKHEQPHFRLGVIVLTLAEALGVKLRNVGATTFRNEESRKRARSGRKFLHCPRQCRDLGLDHIDLTKCPPPDLAIEIDLTSSSVPKEAIYGRSAYRRSGGTTTMRSSFAIDELTVRIKPRREVSRFRRLPRPT